jgi:pyruvate dehydrogenase E2 component (dihydrolipoamide acetyltransferase)
MGERIEIKVPDIGDFTDIPVIEVLVAVGDAVEAEQSLVTLESDKATMEVPSPAAGTIVEIKVALNDTVSEGDLVAVLEASAEAAEKSAEAPATKEAPAASKAAPEKSAKPQTPARKAEATGADAGPRQSPPVPIGADTTLPDRVPYASPAIRAFARELGVDLFRVRGSGRSGRILREDVAAFVKQVMQGGGAPAQGGLQVAPPPRVDFSKFGQTETIELSRIKKIAGKNLHRNWVTIPHVTHNDAADITAMEAFRNEHKGEAKKQGFNLTPLAFLMKATVTALREYPNFNASLPRRKPGLL